MRTCELFKKEMVSPMYVDRESEEWDIFGKILQYGSVDLVGDIMEPGAAKSFVQSYNDTGVAGIYGTKLPLYFQHNIQDPLGYWVRFEEQEDSVMGYAKFYDTNRAKDIRIIAKDKNTIIGGFSIGFSSKNYEDLENEDGKFTGFRFKEITLREASIVTSPAIPEAKISQIKSAHNIDGSLNLTTVERALRDAGASRTEAKRVVHAVKDRILVHIEVDCKGDEEESGEMPEEMEEMESKKLLSILSEINVSAKEKAFLNDINRSFK